MLISSSETGVPWPPLPVRKLIFSSNVMSESKCSTRCSTIYDGAPLTILEATSCETGAGAKAVAEAKTGGAAGRNTEGATDWHATARVEPIRRCDRNFSRTRVLNSSSELATKEIKRLAEMPSREPLKAHLSAPRVSNSIETAPAQFEV